MPPASADRASEPADRDLDRGLARAALRAGALGGAQLWTGVALTTAAWGISAAALSLASESVAAFDSGVAPMASPAELLGAWLQRPIGLAMAALGVLGLALAVAGTAGSARALRAAGARRAMRTTMLGAVLAAVLGSLAAAVASLLGGEGVVGMFGSYGGVGPVAIVDIAAQVAPQLAGPVVADAAVLAVSCTAAGVLTWWVAARVLEPRR